MSKRMSFTVLLLLAFTVLLFSPLVAKAAVSPIPSNERITLAHYTYSGIVTKGPHKGMYLNGGLALRITPTGNFTGYYYTPGNIGLPAQGFIDQRTGELNIAFQKDRIHNMGAIKADGILNRAQMEYNGKFLMSNDDQSQSQGNTKQNTGKDVEKDDSGMWTGVLIDDSLMPLTFQSIVKAGPDKGLVESGVIVLDKKTLKGMLVQATGVMLPYYAQKNDKSGQFNFTLERGKIVGNGKLLNNQQGYAGTFQGPGGDKGEWQAFSLSQFQSR
jgi:hypothetical protein